MRLIDIGNSKGIRLSKNIIGKYHFENGLDLIKGDNCLQLVPLKKKLREGWNKFFLEHNNNIETDEEFLDCDIEKWCD